MLTVNQILSYLNSQATATGGTKSSLPTTLYFYSSTDIILTNGANIVLDGINNSGDI
jgi:hypothetical protein